MVKIMNCTHMLMGLHCLCRQPYFEPYNHQPGAFMKAINKVNLLVVATILIMTVNTYGQWATDAAVNNPVSIATGTQRNVQSVSDGSGGVIVVWEDYRSGAADIYVQRINLYGVAQWTANGVALCTATGQQESPVIVSDGSGGAIVAWQDLRSGNYDIYAQRISTTGVVQWAANGVAISSATLSQQKPMITFAPSGGATIAWEDFRSGVAGTDYDIYAQRINSSGVVQWTTNGVAVCSAIGVQGVASIVGIGSGTESILSWQDYRNGATPDIYAQKINASGAIVWATDGVAICTATNGQFNPAITSDNNSGIGGAVITWEDYRGGNSDIYVQRVNGSGVAQWTSNGVVISSATGNQTKPKIAVTGSSISTITWEDARSGATDVYAQRINSEGTVQWTVNGVAICTSTGAQTNPRIVSGLASDFSNGATITWEDQRGTTYDIYAQQVNSDGVVQWTNNGVPISSASGEQSGVSIVNDSFDLAASKHGVILVWNDERSSNFDIYAQRVNIAGVLCGNVPNPGAITGNSTVFAGTGQTYSITPLTGATSYAWTLPAGWTGSSATASITVTTNATSGNVSVTASNACGTTSSANISVTVNKQNQTITFAPLTAKTFGDANFNLAATASSTLPVSYVSSNTSVATIVGSTVTIVGAGTTTITASQAGNEIFNAAPNVPRDLVVNKANQTITFNALPAKALGDAPFTLGATASSGLTVSYVSANTAIATIAGNTVTLVAVGSVTIHANQAGNNNYNAATQVSQTFCVNPPKPIITATGVNTESPTLTSNAATGNQWFRNDTPIGGATSTTLAITQAGVYKVQVTSGGCTSAFSDPFTFVITAETSSTKNEIEIFPNPVSNRLLVRLPGAAEPRTVSIFAADGRRMDYLESTKNEIEINTAHYIAGFYIVRITSARTNFSSRFTKE